MEEAITTEEKKARKKAYFNEIRQRRQQNAEGWKAGVRGHGIGGGVSDCLAYIQGWVKGRESYNQNVNGNGDGSDPLESNSEF